MSNTGKTTKLLNDYANKLKTQGLSSSSVHHILLERAAEILAQCAADKAEIIAPMLKYMLHTVKKPDLKGDYEKGMGRHYYCSLNYMGKPVSPVWGYYRNGLGHFGKSARSMFEENYTMALTMYHAGFIKQASGYLGRAVHMLCDICCLPHAACMTYFSPNGKLHHAFEEAASYHYPDKMPPVPYILTHYFSERTSFENSLNSISETIRSELPLLHSNPISELSRRLYDSEQKTAALLARFAEDTALSPETAHYLADGMKLASQNPSFPDLTVTVTDRGIILKSSGKTVSHPYNGNSIYFTAAHRKDGAFTFSPARCSKDSVMTGNSYKRFDPANKDQFYISE